MTPSIELKNDQISILYFWNKGIRSAPAIHRKTNIPLRTIYYNIDKLKETNSLKHRGGNSRPRVLEKLSTTYHSLVSASTICRHLHEYGYRNVLPKKTHVLTTDDKNQRVQWAKQHKSDDFTRTIFTDESSFQLFRNTARRWSKCPNNEVKHIPKNRQKLCDIDEK